MTDREIIPIPFPEKSSAAKRMDAKGQLVTPQNKAVIPSAAAKGGSFGIVMTFGVDKGIALAVGSLMNMKSEKSRIRWGETAGVYHNGYPIFFLIQSYGTPQVWCRLSTSYAGVGT